MRFVPILFYVCCSLLYYDYNNTQFSPARFIASITPGARSLVSINHMDLIHKNKINAMNSVGQ